MKRVLIVGMVVLAGRAAVEAFAGVRW